MPQIREYNRQTSEQGNFNTSSVNPDVAAADSNAMVGVGNAVQNIGVAVDRRNQMNELSDANVGMSELQAKHTIKLSEQSADGSFDSTKFLNEYQTDVEKLSERFGTSQAQAFIKENSANSKEHFAINAAATATELASVKFKENITAAKSFYGKAVNNDPTSLDLAIKNYSLYIDTISKGDKRTMKAAMEAKATARGDLAMDSVQGYARLDPDATEAALKEHHYDSYLNVKQKEEMYSYIDRVRNGNEAKAKQQEREVEKAKKLAIENETDDAIVSIYKGNFDPDKVINSTVLPGWDKDRIIKASLVTPEKMDKTAAKHAEIEIRRRIDLPDGDPEKITNTQQIDDEYYFDSRISVQQRDRSARYLKNPLTTEGQTISRAKTNFNKQAYSLIAAGTGGIPQADGPRRMQELYQEVDSYVEEKIKSKKMTQQELYDPANKDSVYGLIQRHQPTLDDNIKAMTNKINPSKNKPSKTPEQFLKDGG